MSRARSVSEEKSDKCRGLEKRTLVLLDYDDTLCPSSWVLEEALVVVEKSSVTDLYGGANAEVEEVMHLVNVQQAQTVSKQETCAIDLLLSILGGGGVDEGSVMLKIITNGDAAWLRQSLRSFLPLMDRYLQHHQVEVVSARDRYEDSFPDDPIQWKIFCFRDEIRSAMELFRERMVKEEATRRQLLPSPSQTSKEAGSVSSGEAGAGTGAGAGAGADGDVEMTSSETKTSGWTQQSTPSSMSSVSMSVEMLSGKSDETESDRMTLEDGGQKEVHSPPPTEAAAIVPPAMEMLVVSIGDGQHERQASHCIANEVDVGCVSIKLIESPSPDILARELVLIKDNLTRIMDHYWDRYHANHSRASGTDEPLQRNGSSEEAKRGVSSRFNSNLDLQVSLSDNHLAIGNYQSEAEMSTEDEEDDEEEAQVERQQKKHHGDRGRQKREMKKKGKEEEEEKEPEAPTTTTTTTATTTDDPASSLARDRGQRPHEQLHHRLKSDRGALFTFFRDLPLDCDGPSSPDDGVAMVGTRRKRSWNQWDDEDENENEAGGGGAGYSSADATEGEDEEEEEEEEEEMHDDTAFSPDSSAGSGFHFFRENAVPAAAAAAATAAAEEEGLSVRRSVSAAWPPFPSSTASASGGGGGGRPSRSI